MRVPLTEKDNNRKLVHASALIKMSQKERTEMNEKRENMNMREMKIYFSINIFIKKPKVLYSFPCSLKPRMQRHFSLNILI